MNHVDMNNYSGGPVGIGITIDVLLAVQEAIEAMHPDIQSIADLEKLGKQIFLKADLAKLQVLTGGIDMVEVETDRSGTGVSVFIRDDEVVNVLHNGDRFTLKNQSGKIVMDLDDQDELISRRSLRSH